MKHVVDRRAADASGAAVRTEVFGAHEVAGPTKAEPNGEHYYGGLHVCLLCSIWRKLSPGTRKGGSRHVRAYHGLPISGAEPPWLQPRTDQHVSTTLVIAIPLRFKLRDWEWCTRCS